MKFNMEKRIIVQPDTFFFNNVFTPVCKQMHYDKKEVTIIAVNKERSEKLKREVKDKYRFVFDYPENNDEVVGTEIFYLGEMI